VIIEVDELNEFLNKTIGFGASNYYISAANLDF